MMCLMAEGIDVHGDKGRIDWRKVRASGVTFAFVKASEGLTFLDARIAENLRDAHAAGVLVGPYHYARPDLRPNVQGAQSEARAFCDKIKAAGYDKRIHARPVLDLEEGAGDLSGWALAFCLRVEELLGVRPIVYSYTFFVRARIAGRPSAMELSKFPLWLANYGPNDGKRHVVSVESPWSAITVHQYTSSGSTPGVSGRCDRNFTDRLNPLFASPVVIPTPLPDAGPDMWTWIRWRRGHGEYKPFGPRNPSVRPPAPRRIPVAWWQRLKINLGIKPSSAGGGPPKVQ